MEKKRQKDKLLIRAIYATINISLGYRKCVKICRNGKKRSRITINVPQIWANRPRNGLGKWASRKAVFCVRFFVRVSLQVLGRTQTRGADGLSKHFFRISRAIFGLQNQNKVGPARPAGSAERRGRRKKRRESERTKIRRIKKERREVSRQSTRLPLMHEKKTTKKKKEVSSSVLPSVNKCLLERRRKELEKKKKRRVQSKYGQRVRLFYLEEESLVAKWRQWVFSFGTLIAKNLFCVKKKIRDVLICPSDQWQVSAIDSFVEVVVLVSH